MKTASRITVFKPPPAPSADLADETFRAAGISREWLEGFLYCHSRMNANTNKILEIGSFAYALIELLMEQGLIRLEELDGRKQEVFKRLKQKFTERGMGVAVLDDDRDKYGCGSGKIVDCMGHLPVCKALCCRFAVALSRQDVEEGRLRWDPGQPYMMARNRSGYCCHIDEETLACTVRDRRPIVCREYDCRHDARVCADYDNIILNSEAVALLAQRREGGMMMGSDLSQQT